MNFHLNQFIHHRTGASSSLATVYFATPDSVFPIAFHHCDAQTSANQPFLEMDTNLYASLWSPRHQARLVTWSEGRPCRRHMSPDYSPRCQPRRNEAGVQIQRVRWFGASMRSRLDLGSVLILGRIWCLEVGPGFVFFIYPVFWLLFLHVPGGLS